MKPQLALALFSLGATCSLFLALVGCTKSVESRFQPVPVMSFDDLQKSDEFVGIVESATVFAPPSSENTGSPPMVGIRLTRSDTTKVIIFQRDPDTNLIAFVRSIRVGEKHRFPHVLKEWQEGSRGRSE